MIGRGLLFCIALLPAMPALAASRDVAVAPPGEKRVALVIGNSVYRSKSLPFLKNPVNDADDVTDALKRFGFTVLERKNVTKRDADEAVAEFGRMAADADVALFYFSGHGVQIKSRNYLIPVDADPKDEAGIPYISLDVNYPLAALDDAHSKVNIIMLDACRDNQMSGQFRSSGGRGLAAPSDVPKGTVIVYATEPGNTASDGTGRNGAFTAGVLAGLKGNDLSLDGVLTTASLVVDQQTHGAQTPYINGPKLLQKNFLFGGSGAQPPPDTTPPIALQPPPKPTVVETKVASRITQVSDESIAIIQFEAGSAEIRPEAQTILHEHTARLDPRKYLVIDGYAAADDSSRLDYATAMTLGSERAAAVRSYLVAFGLNSTRIKIISRGYENPVCTEANTHCASQNRRAIVHLAE